MRKAHREIQFFVNEKVGIVTGLLIQPAEARRLLVLAHGAGAGMRHRFMEELAVKLARENVATLRYHFPYMERHMKRPDPEAVLIETVRAAVVTARKQAGALPIFAGGKSMGGRITSLAAARPGLEGVRGLVYFGFPLHASGRPSAERAEHLARINIPMLFIQGSRDALAELKRMKPLCAKIGMSAELFVVEGGDHSFHVLKSSGRSDEEALDAVVNKAARWMHQHA